MTNKYYSICTMHGLPITEHVCLYCCICFKDLTVQQCADNTDICYDCYYEEEIIMNGATWE